MGITSDKLMNLCEIGLFHTVLKVPVVIIMRFGENNILCPKYIDIYQFWGVHGRHTWSTVHFLFIIKKKTVKV